MAYDRKHTDKSQDLRKITAGLTLLGGSWASTAWAQTAQDTPAQAWLAALGFSLVSLVIAGTLLVAARFLRVRARQDSPLKTRPYECGEEPLGETRIQFHPRYYVVALFFVLFDVEAAFLFPWAVVVKRMGGAGLVMVGSFLGILLLGWLYALRKEALRWQ